MYRDLWTLLIPGVSAMATAMAVGLLLDLPNTALGWMSVGAGALVVTVWGLTRPRHRPR
jgi:hypothetical protein